MIESGLVSTGGHKVPLLGVEVVGSVLADRAHVTVRQRYRNDEEKPVEAVYTFPLPSDAALVGFAMTCAGRRLDAIVKEREEAFRAYDDALVAGHGAALLDQERPNVFTASVGNLLPGEETLIEVTYAQRLAADEGALRWMLPTLVAPRYIPGKPGGDRTGDGHAEPTDVVPDADRITPRIGDVSYGLTLDVVFDLGARIAVESPSHRLQVATEGERTRVRLASESVALDRDLVITARGVTPGPLSGVTGHSAGAQSILALSVVPDLGPAAQTRQDVVFVVDTSGSMAGASIVEAQAALRLCLRHLREGDRFNVIAFSDRRQAFAPALVPFTQKTLEQADAWTAALQANGGTEMLAPLLDAARLAPEGVVILLTDGQVGNEDQILSEVLAARGTARFHTFGIGTNVSDALLGALAKRSGGALEMIHPGERIDEKVVAQFARAVAARVTEVSVTLEGLDAGELVPAEAPALVDGEPWAVFARVGRPGRGRAEIRGKLAGQAFFLAVPIDPEAFGDRPLLTKLWAAERIRDLEAIEVTGRRAGRMKERIVELAVAHGLASRYTSFVVVEERTGARRSGQVPESRFIPVNAPSGWAMFGRRPRQQTLAGGVHLGSFAGIVQGAPAMAPMVAMAPGAALPPPPAGRPPGMLSRVANKLRARGPSPADAGETVAPPARERPSPTLLERQLASGLWDDGGPGDEDLRRLRATGRALLELERQGVTTAHPLHGAQVKKGALALASLAEKVAPAHRAEAQAAVAAAWLVTTGQRTRAEIERRLRALGLEPTDEADLRRRAAELAG
jgi:Ca-activated chloride channel family protein